MLALVKIANVIDRLNGVIGNLSAWLMFPVVLLSVAVVILRYVFGVGYPWLNESAVWLHGAVVLVSAAYVFSVEKHVRVDVFYRRASPASRAWINIFGILFFLAPFICTLYVYSYPTAARSFSVREVSPTPNGLPFMYVMKILVPVFCVLIAMQAFSLLIKSVAFPTRDPRWQHFSDQDTNI